MSILVLKFGGTSVASVELIESAAKIVKSEYEAGNNLVVVVSAMSGATNILIDHVNKINYDLSKPTIKTSLSLNCELANKELGWRRKTLLDVGILKTIKWWKANF